MKDEDEEKEAKKLQKSAEDGIQIEGKESKKHEEGENSTRKR